MPYFVSVYYTPCYIRHNKIKPLPILDAFMQRPSTYACLSVCRLLRREVTPVIGLLQEFLEALKLAHLQVSLVGVLVPDERAAGAGRKCS